MEQMYTQEDEISKSFNHQIQAILSGSGNQLLIIEELAKIQKSIQNLKFFSTNESLKEIQIECLKYLQLPYYLAESFNQIVHNRLNNVNIAKSFYVQYLKLMKHYEIIGDSNKKMWKTLEENPNFEPTRDDKMAQFRQQKELKDKLKYLEKCEDDQIKFDFYMTQFQITIVDTLNALRMIQQETKILEYQDQIKKDPKAKEIHDHKMKQPIQPLQTIHIPKMDSEEPLFFTQNNLVGMTRGQIADEAGKRVFQPCCGQPTETMEESTDRFMAQQHEMQEQEKQKVKQNDDSDDEEVNDRKNYEKRAWDDWKDANEKGAGNKKR